MRGRGAHLPSVTACIFCSLARSGETEYLLGPRRRASKTGRMVQPPGQITNGSPLLLLRAFSISYSFLFLDTSCARG
ncbi:hypothetical protein F5Y10DRAFT_233030 [Nemania abortiva]|nr:hypothetical protein F5Y10DRAFT_233030 [Nemania abortiva]